MMPNGPRKVLHQLQYVYIRTDDASIFTSEHCISFHNQFNFKMKNENKAFPDSRDHLLKLVFLVFMVTGKYRQICSAL